MKIAYALILSVRFDSIEETDGIVEGVAAFNFLVLFGFQVKDLFMSMGMLY